MVTLAYEGQEARNFQITKTIEPKHHSKILRCVTILLTAALGTLLFTLMSGGAMRSGGMIWGSVVFGLIMSEIVRGES
ncbi:MAG: hypothetical protein CXZ00_03500 [Acidobacteria bacterium]|nr:MAG: hypothetical protein CXZ00_03500 [Acidobacteriota bacterium]